MKLVPLRDGKTTWFEPTTDLLCAYCRKSFEVHPRTLGQINFTFEYVVPDPLERGEYWYVHKQCARLEHAFDIHLGWLSMWCVLGHGTRGQKTSGETRKQLLKRMPHGVYDSLFERWLPALRMLKGFREPKSSKIISLAAQPMPKSVKVIQPREKPERPPKPPREPKPMRGGKPGEVYLIEAVGANRIKIGHGGKAHIRLKALSTGTPFPLRLLRIIPASDSFSLEQALQTRYDAYHTHNEWYALPPDVLDALLKEIFS